MTPEEFWKRHPELADASDPKPIGCELNEAVAAYQAQPAPQDAALTTADLRLFLTTLLDMCRNLRKGHTRFQVLLTWITDYQCQRITGRDRIVSEIAGKLGYSDRTVRRHLNSITMDPVLGQVLNYNNARLNGRQRDTGE